MSKPRSGWGRLVEDTIFRARKEYRPDCRFLVRVQVWYVGVLAPNLARANRTRKEDLMDDRFVVTTSGSFLWKHRKLAVRVNSFQCVAHHISRGFSCRHYTYSMMPLRAKILNDKYASMEPRATSEIWSAGVGIFKKKAKKAEFFSPSSAFEFGGRKSIVRPPQPITRGNLFDLAVVCQLVSIVTVIRSHRSSLN